MVTQDWGRPHRSAAGACRCAPAIFPLMSAMRAVSPNDGRRKAHRAQGCTSQDIGSGDAGYDQLNPKCPAGGRGSSGQQTTPPPMSEVVPVRRAGHESLSAPRWTRSSSRRTRFFQRRLPAAAALLDPAVDQLGSASGVVRLSDPKIKPGTGERDRRLCWTVARSRARRKLIRLRVGRVRR